MQKYILSLFIALALFACGRDEVLDKSIIETAFMDNPYDRDFIPLSAYHGSLKKELLLSKTVAELMGAKFPKIYIRSGTRGNSLGACSHYSWGSQIIFFPQDIESEFEGLNPDERFFQLTQIMIHEWVHCGLKHYDHDIDGIMQPEISFIIGWSDQNDLYKKLNQEHGTNLNIEAFNTFYMDNFHPLYWDGKLSQGKVTSTDYIIYKSYKSSYIQDIVLKKEILIFENTENSSLPELLKRRKTLHEIESDVQKIIIDDKLLFPDNTVYQVITQTQMSDLVRISDGKRTVEIYEEHLLPVVTAEYKINTAVIYK